MKRTQEDEEALLRLLEVPELDLMIALKNRIESGPQSEAQWLDEAGAGMSDEEVAAWIETL